jgi:hypothetical protein
MEDRKRSFVERVGSAESGIISTIGNALEASLKKRVESLATGQDTEAVYNDDMKERPALRALLDEMKAGKLSDAAVDNFHEEQAGKIATIKDRLEHAAEITGQIHRAFDSVAEKELAKDSDDISRAEKERNLEEAKPWLEAMASPEMMQMIGKMGIALEEGLSTLVDQGIEAAHAVQQAFAKVSQRY